MHATNPLLHLHRIPGHVEMHETAGALQIDTLTTGAGRDEELRTCRILEPGHLLIPLRIGLPANDDGGTVAGYLLQPVDQSQHGFDWLGEENDLFLSGRLKNVAVEAFPFQL